VQSDAGLKVQVELLPLEKGLGRYHEDVAVALLGLLLTGGRSEQEQTVQRDPALRPGFGLRERFSVLLGELSVLGGLVLSGAVLASVVSEGLGRLKKR
jgi:hypothetical protein